MNVRIEDTCISCGVCIDTCPDVFEMGEEIAITLCEKVPSSLIEQVEEAAYDCPVDAIILTGVE
jgi:ferredoxin